MPQETHNQTRTYAPLLPGFTAGADNAVNHGFKRHATRSMGLRIEKYFRMHDIVFTATLKIRTGQIVKIRLVQQYAGTGIINIQKRLQIVKIISLPYRIDIFIRNRYVVALGDFKHQLRLERPFDMDVQLGFGQGLDKLFNIHIFSDFRFIFNIEGRLKLSDGL